MGHKLIEVIIFSDYDGGLFLRDCSYSPVCYMESPLETSFLDTFYSPVCCYMEHDNLQCDAVGIFQEPIPVTQLVREIAAVMQEFTQSG